MTDILFLAGRYLLFHRWKTFVLVMAITLVVFLPAALNVLVERSAQQLTARAKTTPLLIGAKGSPLELTLSSLYFDGGTPTLTRYREVANVRDSQLANPIPLYVRFRASGYAIVGTTLDYVEFRKLEYAEGRSFAMLGETVIGATVASELGLSVGDSVVSSPESAFDLAGVYPLKLTVVGIFEPTFTADDESLFVDLKTAWVIEGLGHGHQNLETAEASVVLQRDENRIVANASLLQYNEITPENAESFHFHGDLGEFPVSAILVVPNDTKSGVILQGRVENSAGDTQIVRPSLVIEALLATVLTVQQYVVAAVALVGLATVSLAVLVFLLSLRLRQRERLTLYKIGSSRGVVTGLMAAEVLAVIAASAVVSALLTTWVSFYGADLIREFLLS